MFNSNARPYLIDCYVKNDGINSTKKSRKKKKRQMEEQKHQGGNMLMSPWSASTNNGDNFGALSPQNPMMLSSSFILKRGISLENCVIFEFCNCV